MEYDGEVSSSYGWTDPRRKVGELICPAYRSMTWVDREKVTMGVYAWSAQYNQQPVPRGNGFFNVDEFVRFDPEYDLPQQLNYYIASDHALGLTSKADYNVFQVWGLDKDKRYWLVDTFRDRCSFMTALGIESKDGRYAVSQTGAFAMIKKYKPLAWFADGDNIIKSNGQTIKDAMRQTGIACRHEIVQNSRATGNKIERASALQTQSQLGNVMIPLGLMGETLIAELQAFPVGKHDDQVDAASILPRMRAHAAYIAPTERSRSRDHDYHGDDDPTGGETSISNCF
jgi:predicted phage terminase large subunit-like protein